MGPIRLVARYMRDHDLTLVTAESCCAGLIAATLAETPGAGKLLDCAYVVYTPEAKQACLGVSSDTLDRFNLTSEEVAREMATGALSRSRANVAISNTGVVDATDPSIAPGTQCFGWAFTPDGQAGELGGEPIVFTETKRFTGNRIKIRKAASLYALHRISHYHQQLDAGKAPAQPQDPTS